MKINNNISAVITNKQLLGTESKLSASMERLASGLKLNHASDNPSGMAISNKMNTKTEIYFLWLRAYVRTEYFSRLQFAELMTTMRL